MDEEIRPIKIVEEGLLAKMLEYQKNKQTDSIKLAMPKFKALQSQLYKKIENFLSIHPNSYAALVCYDRYGKKISTGPAIIDSLEKMPDKYKTLDLYKSIVSKYKATETFAIGKQIKHFTLLDDMGEPFNTNSLKGKYILIDFWASWCVPCRKENPNLRLNYKKYNSKGFEILSVSIDTDTAAWRAAIKADQLKWKQVIGRQSDPQIEKYAITQIPTSYLINPDGKIIGVNVRGKELDSELEKIFKEL